MDAKFFQAVAAVIPTLLIAFAFTSKFLEFDMSKPGRHSVQPDSGKNAEDVHNRITIVGLGGIGGIVGVWIVVFLAAAMEIITLAALAYEVFQLWIFIFGCLSIALLTIFIGLKAIEPLLQHAPFAEEDANKLKKKRERFANWIVAGALVVVIVVPTAVIVTMAVTAARA